MLSHARPCVLTVCTLTPLRAHTRCLVSALCRFAPTDLLCSSAPSFSISFCFNGETGAAGSPHGQAKAEL